MFLPKRRLTFNGLHGVVLENTELLVTNAVKTSNQNKYKTAGKIIASYIQIFKFLDTRIVIVVLIYHRHKHIDSLNLLGS
jgi:hypothetical protein